MAERFEAVRHQRGQIGKRPVRFGDAAEFNISHRHQENHAAEHDAAHQGVDVHHSLEAADGNVNGDEQSKTEQGDRVGDMQCFL